MSKIALVLIPFLFLGCVQKPDELSEYAKDQIKIDFRMYIRNGKDHTRYGRQNFYKDGSVKWEKIGGTANEN